MDGEVEVGATGFGSNVLEVAMMGWLGLSLKGPFHSIKTMKDECGMKIVLVA